MLQRNIFCKHFEMGKLKTFLILKYQSLVNLRLDD